MKRRKIRQRLDAALADTPVVLLNGARQTGKTTLAQSVAEEHSAARYLSLDDATVLAAAATDPAGFLEGLDGLVILDEVQKVPELMPAIKQQVDRDRRPGRYLLTGSANVLMLPKVSESLAGRMEVLTLWPFSQGELEEGEDAFVDAVFAERLPELGAETPTPSPLLPERLLRGGYPVACERSPGERRNAWFASYVTTILQRDVRDLANIEGLTEMPRLLALLSTRVGSLINRSDLSRASGLAYTTLNRYLTLLEMTFLLQPLPAWSSNLGKRLTRAPKIHLVDSGLVAHFLGLSEERLDHDPIHYGPLLEAFVWAELRKQTSWSRASVDLFHYRTSAGAEVDFVLEDRAGRLVGIEVKASSKLGRKDFRGLESLAESAGPKFHRGVVLYTGENVVPFGSKSFALPLPALWRLPAEEHD